MGLSYPRDLEAWRRWHDSQRPLRALKGRFVRHDPELVVATTGADPQVVIAVEAWHRSVRLAVAEVLAHVSVPVAVVGPSALRATLPEGSDSQDLPLSAVGPWLERHAARAQAVLAAGHYTPLGAVAYRWARERDLAFWVAQHGLLTPLAPPLPEDARLLAWSDDDAAFWRSGRTDGTCHVVGSQLLWTAAASPAPPVADSPLTWLGQLHGAELPTADVARATEQFCLAHSAHYRPHPSETDRHSRRLHARWRDLGITVDDAGRPLLASSGPVVGVFSTGLLEAAAAGRAAYHFFPDPPPWLAELWQRYALAPYDAGVPSAPPTQPQVEPARAIAALIEEDL